MLKTLIGLFFFAGVSFSYVPPAQSLLENRANPPIEKNSLELNYLIYELPVPINSLLESNASFNPAELLKTYSLSLEFYLGSGVPELMVELYEGPTPMPSKLIHFKKIKNLNRVVNNEEVFSPYARNFMGAIFLSSLNSSTIIQNFLSRVGIKVQPRQSLIKKDVESILKSEIAHIKTHKNEENSPLNPKDIKKKKEIRQVLNQGMYRRDRILKPKYIHENTYLTLENESAALYFQSKNGRFAYIKEDIFEMRVHDYESINSKHFVPKIVEMRTSSFFRMVSKPSYLFDQDFNKWYNKGQKMAQIAKGIQAGNIIPDFLP